MSFSKLVIIVFCNTFGSLLLKAQDTTIQSVAGIDSTMTGLRVGRLANGLTYYLRHFPSDRIQLCLQVRVGIQDEKDSELEIAHLIEHLTFRETKNFPEGTRRSLERLGLKRGKDVSGSTGFFSTKYRLVIPSRNRDLLETALLVVKDWASNLQPTDNSIASEKSAILEESRIAYSSVDFRLHQKVMCELKPASESQKMYVPDRTRNLPTYNADSVLKFYNKWYRPDMETLIVVGDFNIKELENEIIALYGTIQNRTNTVKRMEGMPYNLTGNQQFKVITDAEKQGTEIQIHFKKSRNKVDFEGTLKLQLIAELYDQMMLTRLTLLNDYLDPSIKQLNSSINIDELPTNIDVLTMRCTVSGEKKIETAIKQTIGEIERLKRFGFSEAELIKAKAIINNIRFARKSDGVQNDIVNIYLKQVETGNSQIEDDRNIHRSSEKIFNEISVADVNRMVIEWTADVDRAIFLLANDSIVDRLPIRNSINEWILEAQSAEIEKFVLNDEHSQLLSTESILKLKKHQYQVTTMPHLGLTNVTLSNGVRILLKPLPEKPNASRTLILQGVSPGGAALHAQNDSQLAVYSANVISRSGFSDITKSQLSQLMADWNVAPYVSNESEGFNGYCTVKDFEQMLQLIFRYFTDPYVSGREFESWKSRRKEELGLAEQLSALEIMDSLSYPFRADRTKLSVKNIDRTTGSKMLAIFKQRFSNVSDFTFFISGHFDSDSIITLLDLYLGSLPTKTQRESVLPSDTPSKIPKRQSIVRDGQSNIGEVVLQFTGNYEYNPSNNATLNVVNKMLNRKLFTRLREIEAGVYSVITNLFLDPHSGGTYRFRVDFKCDPKNAPRLIAAVQNEINQLGSFGPSDDEFQKAVKDQMDEWAVNQQKPGFWVRYLVQQFEFNRDFAEFFQTKERLANVTVNDIKIGVVNWLKEENLVQIILQ